MCRLYPDDSSLGNNRATSGLSVMQQAQMMAMLSSTHDQIVTLVLSQVGSADRLMVTREGTRRRETRHTLLGNARDTS